MGGVRGLGGPILRARVSGRSGGLRDGGEGLPESKVVPIMEKAGAAGGAGSIAFIVYSSLSLLVGVFVDRWCIHLTRLS